MCMKDWAIDFFSQELFHLWLLVRLDSLGCCVWQGPRPGGREAVTRAVRLSEVTRRLIKPWGCFLPHLTLAILILACQTEKQFFCPSGRRRTRKMSLLISRPAKLSPPQPTPSAPLFSRTAWRPGQKHRGEIFICLY